MSGVDQPPFLLSAAPAAKAAASVPLFVTSPHSGCDYPQSFLDASRLDAHQIRQSEDMFVAELFADAPALGIGLLAARFPRAFVDLNRAPFELEPALFDGPLPDHIDKQSLRAAAGLGTVPRLVAENVPIYKAKLRFEEAENRIETVYRPFHAELSRQLDALHDAHGWTLLIDAHSMPSQAVKTTSHNRIDFVVGTRHGRAADPQIVDLVCNFLSGLGWRVARDKPYAGGFITEQYGVPLHGRHALQIEINRALYMDEASYEKHDGFDRIKADMKKLLSVLQARLPQLAAHWPDPTGTRSAAE